MPYNYSRLARNRANINGNNYITGGGGNCRGSIGGNAFIRHVKNRNTGPASDKKKVFAINVLSGGVGRERTLFRGSADGLNLAVIKLQQNKNK